MSRLEQIEAAALSHAECNDSSWRLRTYGDGCFDGFMEGAQWADAGNLDRTASLESRLKEAEALLGRAKLFAEVTLCNFPGIDKGQGAFQWLADLEAFQGGPSPQSDGVTLKGAGR